MHPISILCSPEKNLAQTHTWNEAFYEQLLDSLEQGGK